MRHDGNRTSRDAVIKRVIIYTLLVLFLSVAQCSFFASLDICPATPDLIIGAVIAIAMLDGIRSAMVVGICAGFLCDALSKSGSLAFSALFYLIAALLLGAIAEKMLPRFMSWICLMLGGLIMRAVYTALLVCASIRSIPSASLLISAILPELIVTAILCLPIYPIIRLCVIPLRSHSRFSF